MNEFGLGYRRDLEDFANLAALATPFVKPDLFAAPTKISHREWRKPARNQGPMGSCTGHGTSSGEEILNFIGSAGQRIHCSAMYSYLEAQRACGMLGQDQGATINGAVQAAKSMGTALEATFPYPNPVHYTTRIPSAAETEGRLHLIRNHAVMHSYDDVYNFLATGTGVVVIGVTWTSGMSRCGSLMDLDALGGQVLGGHCMLLEGYDSEKTDSNGRPCIDMENSHGSGWADGGWAMVAPRVIDHWFQAGATLIGISDLTTFAPRPIPSWEGILS